MLRLDDVAVRLGDTRIGPVSLSVEAGGVVGLTGPSGVGKSTVARIAAGVLAPDSGRRLLDGVLTSRWGWAAPAGDRRRVQLVSQHPHREVDPRHTLAEALTLPARLHGFPAGDPLDWADRCHVDRTLLTRRPAEVSGGQLQRVVLARALSVGPDVLIADEVTTAQDAITTLLIMDLLRETARDGVAVLVISHDLPLVARLAATQVELARPGSGRVESG
ncbi:ABC transporter ATP-binding protein [Propionibacteriaceae bacterium Y2011]